MGTTFEWFSLIALPIVVVFMVFLHLVKLWCFITCFKEKKFDKCFDKTCKFHNHCFRYEDVITEEDIEELEKLLDQL